MLKEILIDNRSRVGTIGCVVEEYTETYRGI